ncbi:hypothetical protein [Streptomyces sp. MZ04]|uniref:hypothetical protein n=1 Tax=Streptomyces sp. MZ04 TaxID=2559236 RepID=UPI001432AAEE|nr:hypothetical protein [Streptomyces sp. MZ04]
MPPDAVRHFSHQFTRRATATGRGSDVRSVVAAVLHLSVGMRDGIVCVLAAPRRVLG